MSLFQRAEELRKKLNQQLEEKGAFGTAAVIAALHKQDKITRHACAEAILALPRHRVVNESNWEGVDINQASAACINVKME